MVRQFTDSSINIQLFFWIKNINDSEAVKSDIFLAIDRAFKEHSIGMPFYNKNDIKLL